MVFLELRKDQQRQIIAAQALRVTVDALIAMFSLFGNPSSSLSITHEGNRCRCGTPEAFRFQNCEDSTPNLP